MEKKVTKKVNKRVKKHRVEDIDEVKPFRVRIVEQLAADADKMQGLFDVLSKYNLCLANYI